jgi:hypothetical protein
MTNAVQKREPLMLPANSRKRTALHEAAHAVAAKAYRLPIDFAEAEGARGQVVFAEGWVDARAFAWASVVTALAGPQGELAFCNDEAGGNGDFETAEHFAREVDLDFSDEVVRLAQTAATMIVRDNRVVISRLAAVLEHKGKLSGAEIDGISGEVRPGPAAPDMTPIARARRDAARRRARRDYEGAAFIEKWIKQQERAP